MSESPDAGNDRLQAACNQAAVQFHGMRFTELDLHGQMLLRKKVRMILKAADAEERRTGDSSPAGRTH